jgi:hypothetical protein
VVLLGGLSGFESRWVGSSYYSFCIMRGVPFVVSGLCMKLWFIFNIKAGCRLGTCLTVLFLLGAVVYTIDSSPSYLERT